MWDSGTVEAPHPSLRIDRRAAAAGLPRARLPRRPALVREPKDPRTMNSEQKTKTNERQRKRYADDPEYRARKLADNRAHRKRKRDKCEADPQLLEKDRASQRSRIWKHRNITNAATLDYDAMFARQGGVCKICRRPSRTRLCLDHDHDS